MSDARSQVGRVVRGVKRRLHAATADPAPVVDTGPPDLSSTISMFRWCQANRPESAARPNYLWGSLQAASDAKGLRLEAVSVVELGVAGGNGLLALEQAAAAAEDLLGIPVSVTGFDSGVGMPPPTDHKDAPWAVKPGYFAMDEDALRGRLRRADLVVGPVADTLRTWLKGDHPAVGFASLDLDYYSSTVDAMQLFEAGPDRVLPRVACYFDDVFGYGWTDFMGERQAIDEFNAAHATRKVAKVHGLKYELPESERHQPWPEQIYVAHLFDHPRYDDFVFEPSAAWFDAHRLG